MFFNYFPIESEVLNVYKTIDFGDIPESDQYNIHTPDGSESLMNIAYKYYGTIDDWWILYYFNKFNDPTFAVIPSTVVESTISYYVNLYKNYNISSIKDKMIIRECVIQFYIYKGKTYTDAISLANTNLSNPSNASDPIMISDLKDFLFIYVMEETTYSDPIKIPTLQVAFRMKSVMNSNQISWN
jgi:hypothetical protein